MTQRTINHVFIVGVPRSGTTLMRDLLSRHPQVAMPQDEFQLIPFLIKRFGLKAVLDDTDVDRYLAILKRSAFYHHRKVDTSLKNWRPTSSTLPEIITETLQRFAPEGLTSDLRYIGDKTPNNLLHLNAISEAFPGCKFIHVVRDPRDVALSARKAWKKSLTRVAYQWQCGVTAANDFYQEHPEAILTVRYEDLLADSRNTLTSVCNFLDLPFDESLLELTGSREKMGDAAGFPGLKTDNTGKYEQGLSQDECARLISYLHTEMCAAGYSVETPEKAATFNQVHLTMLSFADFWGSLRQQTRDKGVLAGFRYRVFQLIFR